MGATGPLSGSVSEKDFTVTPAITLSTTGGTAGTTVTVTGVGFGANERNITVALGPRTMETGISANAQGSWTATITAPPLPAGSYPVTASGSLTSTAGVAAEVFTIGASITVSPTTGPPGTPVTITGSGFGPNEVNIAIRYNGAEVAKGINASPVGSFTAQVTIPPSPAGARTLKVSGPATKEVEVSFAVTPVLALSRGEGMPGTTVTVTGSGFGANETGISVAYSGVPVASGIRADAQGSWSATFATPPLPGGSHSVSASGSTTPAARVPGASFTSTPIISLAK